MTFAFVSVNFSTREMRKVEQGFHTSEAAHRAYRRLKADLQMSGYAYLVGELVRVTGIDPEGSIIAGGIILSGPSPDGHEVLVMGDVKAFSRAIRKLSPDATITREQRESESERHDRLAGKAQE